VRLRTLLRALERHSPKKHSTQWVAVPRWIAFETPRTDSPHCLACVIAAATRGTENGSPRLLTEADRKALIRGPGIDLKVLLTIYRWARPYTRLPVGAPPGSYEHQAIASLTTSDLAMQALGLEQGESLRTSTRTARRSLHKLKDMHLLEAVEDRGRSRPNFYAPHRIEPTIRIPSGLWQNGWIRVLSGGGLLALLRLLGHQQEPPSNSAQWARTPRAVRAIAQRGQLLSLDLATILGIERSTSLVRHGLSELTELRLISEVRTRSGVFIALLDMEMLKPPSRMDERWFSVKRIASMLAVDERTVRGWLQDHTLVGRNFGGRIGWRVRETAVSAFVEEKPYNS
jgi:hypothetical protein